MKKVLKKLALNRETLASLQPDVLEGIAGGNHQSAIVSVTKTITPTTSTTRPPRTISVCPSIFNCPSIPSLASAAASAAGGGQGGQ